MADETRSVRVLLRAEANQLVLEFGKAGAASNQLAGNLDRSGKSLGTMIRQARNLALAGGIAKVVKSAVELEAAYSRTMAMIAVQTKAPQDELKKLDDLAMQLGRDTVFSAQDAADAMLSLAKGGLTVGQIKAGALKDSLTLAAAGGLELDEAAKGVVNTMGAFELRADQTGVAVAALAGGANASSADVSDMTQSLAQAGTEAHSVGLSVQETTAFLAAFANAGIKGSDAGTSLRTMLQRLVPQTDKQRAEMDRLHLSFTDANGEFVNAEQIAQRMQDTFGDMSAKERSLALSTIFGSDARRAANVITRLGAEGTRKLIAETSDLTQAQKLADANMSGTAGALEQLKGSVETLGIEFGKVLAPTIQDVAKGLTHLTDAVIPLLHAFGKLPESTQELLLLSLAGAGVAKGLRGIGAIGRQGGGGLIVLGGGASKATKELGLLARSGATLKKAGLFGEIALLAGGGFELFDTFSKHLKDSGASVSDTLSSINSAIAGSDLGKFAEDLDIDTARLAKDLQENGRNGEYFQEVLERLQETGKVPLGLDKLGLGEFSEKGKARHAADALKEIAEGFTKAKSDAQDFFLLMAGTAFDLNFGLDTFKDAAGNVRVLADELKTLPTNVQSTFTLQGFDLSEKQLVDFIAKYDLTDVQIQALIEADPTPADATLEQLRADAKEIKTQLVLDNLNDPISALLNGLGGLGPVLIPLDGDPGPLNQTAEEKRAQLAQTVATMLIDGNTDAANQRRDELVDLINGTKPVVPVDANTNPGKTKVNNFVSDTNSKEATITVRVKLIKTVLDNFDNLKSGLGGNPHTGGRMDSHGRPHYAVGGRVVPGVAPREPWVDNVPAAMPSGHQLMVRSGEWIINEPASKRNDAWLRAVNAGLNLDDVFAGRLATRYPVRHAAGGLDPGPSNARAFATASAVGAAPQTEIGVISADLRGARVDIGKDGMLRFVDGRVQLGIRHENKYRNRKG